MIPVVLLKFHVLLMYIQVIIFTKLTTTPVGDPNTSAISVAGIVVWLPVVVISLFGAILYRTSSKVLHWTVRVYWFGFVSIGKLLCLLIWFCFAVVRFSFLRINFPSGPMVTNIAVFRVGFFALWGK